MAFKMKYIIETEYIPSGTKRRSGIAIDGGKPNFGVLHDTGNTGSTAKGNVHYYINSRNDDSASAHTFIDDKHIIECIPLTTGKPEKAWHVLYGKPTDNKLFGDDANDKACGVELCYGGDIDFKEAYKRYVWYNAYCAYKFGFAPTRFAGHHILDPERKTDPVNALKRYNQTYAQLLKDIVAEYNECTATTSKPVEKPKADSEPYPGLLEKGSKGKAVGTLQKALKIKVDNDFGPATEKAVKVFQKKNGLTDDGKVGKLTWSKLF
jgi:N-acetylmuramoyl-L-alanine amidase CwlA